MILSKEMSMGEVLRSLPATTPVSRFRLGSPCKFIRSLDVLVHIVLPELIENVLPRVARYLRSTSPRWGRSWRTW
jgi:hypothetical protein